MSSTAPEHAAPSALADTLGRALEQVRAQTLALIEPLDDAALAHQHSPLMSPLVWDLGHIANFEALWLLTRLGHQVGDNPRLGQIYNPFENPRSTRGELDLLERRQVLHYMREVRAQVLDTLAECDFDPSNPLLRDGYVYWMIIQHETQHQETMLQTLDLSDAIEPYPGAAHTRDNRADIGRRATSWPEFDDTARREIPAGDVTIGTADQIRAYDNERPAHPRQSASFILDRYPVTCRRYLEFMADAGYDRAELWSDAGWAWRDDSGCRAPQGWHCEDNEWTVRRFGHRIALDPRTAVQHVCFHEAEAFARWDGGRLPTEHEWEAAARAGAPRETTYPWGSQPADATRANIDLERFGPAQVGEFAAGASAAGVEQLLGDVYEWTSSPFVGYEGFESFPYPEYSEVFFGSEYRVLRGASWATSRHCARITFRNWDFPIRRQIFAGLRVARDL